MFTSLQVESDLPMEFKGENSDFEAEIVYGRLDTGQTGALVLKRGVHHAWNVIVTRHETK